MGKKKLAGTVPRYDRHILLCYQNSEAWPPRFHKSKLDTFPKLFINHFSDRMPELPVRTMVTICESSEGTGYDEGDVLIFPDMIKYKRLKDSDIGEFIDDVLVKDVPWASGVQEKLTGCHIFVCAHGSRHEIYRLCAPVLVEKLNEVVEARGLQGQVYVSGCSDVYGPARVCSKLDCIQIRLRGESYRSLVRPCYSTRRALPSGLPFWERRGDTT